MFMSELMRPSYKFVLQRILLVLVYQFGEGSLHRIQGLIRAGSFAGGLCIVLLAHMVVALNRGTPI